MDRVLLESVEDGVLTLTMNRPDRLNALTGGMLQGLHDSITRAAADPALGVIFLTGAGRGFRAGGPLKAMADRAERDAPYDDRVQGLRRRMDAARLLHDTA